MRFAVLEIKTTSGEKIHHNVNIQVNDGKFYTPAEILKTFFTEIKENQNISWRYSSGIRDENDKPIDSSNIFYMSVYKHLKKHHSYYFDCLDIRYVIVNLSKNDIHIEDPDIIFKHPKVEEIIKEKLISLIRHTSIEFLAE